MPIIGSACFSHDKGYLSITPKFISKNIFSPLLFLFSLKLMLNVHNILHRYLPSNGFFTFSICKVVLAIIFPSHLSTINYPLKQDLSHLRTFIFFTYLFVVLSDHINCLFLFVLFDWRRSAEIGVCKSSESFIIRKGSLTEN